jgi:mono/diheme cytochrome c family protein
MPHRTGRSGTTRAWLSVLLVLFLAACGTDEAATPDRAAPDTAEEGLTAFQLEHGIGPFTTAVTLDDPVDMDLAATGEQVYQMNCEACHMMEDRFVGPPLGDVLERRSPTFVLNMIMNPEQMAREHPEGQAMLREYPLIMPYQNITEDQALAILEYLRIAGD